MSVPAESNSVKPGEPESESTDEKLAASGTTAGKGPGRRCACSHICWLMVYGGGNMCLGCLPKSLPPHSEAATEDDADDLVWRDDTLQWHHPHTSVPLCDCQPGCCKVPLDSSGDEYIEDILVPRSTTWAASSTDPVDPRHSSIPLNAQPRTL
jgi:hypothetical protein